MHPSTPQLLSLGLVTALAVAGMAWHECVLLAAAAAAAYRLFLWRMDAGAPWDAWRAGLRCLFAGLLGLLVAATLCALIVAGLAGFWAMDHRNGGAVLALLTGAAALIVGIQLDAPGRWAEARLWGILLGGAALAFAAVESGYPMLPCLFTGAVAAWLAWVSWHLARDQASDLLSSGEEM